MAIMTQNAMRWQTRPVSRVLETQVVKPASTAVNEDEILRVLDRAAQDPGFIADILKRGSAALRGYSLTLREKAALVTGDMRWLEGHIGRLSDQECTLLNCVLQREAW